MSPELALEHAVLHNEDVDGSDPSKVRRLERRASPCDTPSPQAIVSIHGHRHQRLRPATYHTHGDAIAVSRGLDRDRVVDETGGQTVVFGRRGARPFKLSEMSPFFRRLDGGGVYKVEDVRMAGDKLTSASGAMLSPLPTATPAPTEPRIEPTPLPLLLPEG